MHSISLSVALEVQTHVLMFVPVCFLDEVLDMFTASVLDHFIAGASISSSPESVIKPDGAIDNQTLVGQEA